MILPGTNPGYDQHATTERQHAVTYSETYSEDLEEEYPRPKLLAIDPWNCGCTECLLGEYKPLRNATPEDLAKMLTGHLGNHTGITFTMTATIAAAIPSGATLRTATTEHEVIVSCEYRSWTLNPRTLGFPIQ